MVHFPGFARARLWIHRAVRGVYPRGFPHSEIPGSMPTCGSPRLIAACHVLHRLLLPRHPPCALSSLTTKFTRHTQASSYQLLATSYDSNTPRKFHGPSYPALRTHKRSQLLHLLFHIPVVKPRCFQVAEDAECFTYTSRSFRHS